MTYEDYKKAKRDWHLKFAPQGYRWTSRRISFETIEEYCDVLKSAPINHALESMLYELQQKVPADVQVDKLVHTFITVYPLRTGENMNCLDPLNYRLGIQIDLRLPL